VSYFIGRILAHDVIAASNVSDVSYSIVRILACDSSLLIVR